MDPRFSITLTVPRPKLTTLRGESYLALGSNTCTKVTSISLYIDYRYFDKVRISFRRSRLSSNPL